MLVEILLLWWKLFPALVQIQNPLRQQPGPHPRHHAHPDVLPSEFPPIETAVGGLDGVGEGDVELGEGHHPGAPLLRLVHGELALVQAEHRVQPRKYSRQFLCEFNYTYFFLIEKL